MTAVSQVARQMAARIYACHQAVQGTNDEGTTSQKRPADTVANAIRVAKVLTGEIEDEDPADSGKDKAGQSMGRRGGAARRDKLSPERRAEIARKAAAKRRRK